VRRALTLVAVVAVTLAAAPAAALNKQGARKARAATDAEPTVDASGSLFGGVFLFNPTYAARPNNSGVALYRFGLHLDVDLYKRWLTLSYDENSFTDGSPGARNPLAPSEYDQIVGLLSTVALPHDLELTLAAHLEYDLPGAEARKEARPPDYQVGYSQAYVDAYARLGFARGRLALFAALGGFLWNPSYASRPDNSGVALLRYVLHGELRLLPWLAYRLDLNFFTDRDEMPLSPTECDVTSELGVRLADDWELRFVGEADLPIGAYPANGPNPANPAPGLRQFYLAGLLQWSFDVRELVRRARR
jgi:hypothetical protein